MKKEDKRAADCCREVSLCFCLYVVVGMATWSEAAGPPDLARTNPQMWSSCFRSLCWGARREELHQG